MDLKEAEVLGEGEDTHWYYVAKGEALRAFLGDVRVTRLLDVGAGSGIFARQFVEERICASAVCVDTGYEANRTEGHDHGTIEFVRAIDTVDHDLIMMIDVLEHVDDDVALIRQYLDPAPIGTKLLVSVPAFELLWSAHDDFLEHKRRYTLGSLTYAIEDAGLSLLRSRYYFATLFPAVAMMRIVSRLTQRTREPRSAMRQLPKWASATLLGLHRIERMTAFHLNRAYGLSAFALAEKR